MVKMLRGFAPRVSAASTIGGTEQRPGDDPTQLDRARRLHSTHQRGPGRRCGLCLQSWPCPERSWADQTLRVAGYGIAQPRWSGPLWSMFRSSVAARPPGR